MESQDSFPAALYRKITFENQQFQTAVDNLLDAFAVLDPLENQQGKVTDFTFIYINLAGADNLQLQNTAVIEKKMSDFFPFVPNAGLFRACIEVIKTGLQKKLSSYEYLVRFPGNELKAIADICISKLGNGITLNWRESIPAKETRISDGGVAGQTKEDFSEPLTDHFSLTLKEISLADILAQLPSGISIAEAHTGKFLFHNAQASKLIRHQLLSSEDYAGFAKYGALHDLQTPYKPEEYPITRALNGETIFGEEMLYRRGDGTLTYFSVNAAPVKNAKGETIVAISSFDDISYKKQVEEALRESEAKLLDAQKLAHFGNYVLDIINNKIDWSDEMFELWEFDKDKPIPAFEQLWDLVHPEDRDRLKEILTRKKPGSDKVETEFRILFPENRIKYIHLITRVFFDGSGNLIKREGVEIDITERKLTELALGRTLKELERSNNELQEFAYVASHDLQEPLRMVSSYMQLLSRKYESQLDRMALEFINFAVDGSKRMDNLIKGLLSYSRITTRAHEFEPVDLDEVLNTVLVDLRVLTEESKAEIHIGALPVIQGDELQMYQLFQNLIANAIKFRDDKPLLINVKSGKKGNLWVLSVEDNGIGIAAEFYERIFVIFQRLHEREKYPGTGLGLAICKKIVERHGGSIWVESVPGKGTTFYFTIPGKNTIA